MKKFVTTNEGFNGGYNFSINEYLSESKIRNNYKFTNGWNAYISFARVTREPAIN